MNKKSFVVLLLLLIAAQFVLPGVVLSADTADKLCFIQFIHPGGEHKPDSGTIRTWNADPHLRKFVKSPGKYMTAIDGQAKDGDITFWVEWEPSSIAVKKYEAPVKEGPKYLFVPWLEEFPADLANSQTTDPWVFGDKFYYSFCLQNTSKGPTGLRYLAKGTVILFGSCIGQEKFVVDTVFVVADYVDYNDRNYEEKLKGVVPPEYLPMAVYPVYKDPARGDDEGDFRLYIGATYDKPYNGMFSYVPSQPYTEEGKGFPRPAVAIPDIITNNLSRGKRFNEQKSMEDTVRLWNEATAQMLKQGAVLGVLAEMPEWPKQDAILKK